MIILKQLIIPSLTIPDVSKPVIKREPVISIVETPSFEYNDSYNNNEEYDLSKDIEELFKDAGMKTNISAIITNLKIFSEKLRDNPSVLLFREKEVK